MLRPTIFLLLAALLLAPAADAAYPLPFVPPDPASLKWHTITFQYAKPGDVLTLMGYTGGALPAGVAQVVVLPDSGSLRIDANDAGFSAFRDRLNAALNIGPKQVRLKIVVASLPKSRQIDIDLSSPNHAMSQMREAGAAFHTLPSATVTDGDSASFVVDWPPVDYLSEKGSEFKAVPTLSVRPSIADSDSVFLGIGLEIPSPPGIYTIPIWSDYTDPPERHSKIMAVYHVADGVSSESNRVFVFVTPTVIEPTVNHGEAITVTP